MGKPVTYWYYFDRYRLSIGERVLYENQIVKLSTTQFETLRVLIESGGKPLDKSDMAATVCPTAADGQNTIERAVSDLRDKLRDPVGESRIIRRAEGGYRFAAEVRKVQHVDFEGVSEEHSQEMMVAEGEFTSKKNRWRNQESPPKLNIWSPKG